MISSAQSHFGDRTSLTMLAPVAPPKAKWTKLLVGSTLGSTLGAAVPAGYCMGIINNPAAHMRSWCVASLQQKYGLELSPASLDTLWALIVAIYLIGGVLGSACAGWATDRFGRRGCLLLSGFLLLLAALGFFCCRGQQSVELLLICRLVVGMGGGLISTGLPMYHSEIAALPQRGTLGACCSVGFSTGIVLAQVISMESLLGNERHWHLALSFYVVIMVFCFAPYTNYAESPKWLFIVKGRREASRSMLVRLRGTASGLESELQAMELEASSKCNSRGLTEVLRDPKMLLPLVLLCSYQGGQQLTGCSSIYYYSVSIFRSSGLSARVSELLNLCAGNINLGVALLSPLLMAKFNRRTLMLISTSFCALLMLTFGIFVEFSTEIPWLIYGTIASVFLYLVVFQLALGPMPSFIGTELFEVPSRSVANSLGNQMGWGCNFLVGFLFPSMHSLLGFWIFIVFAFFGLLLFLLTKFYLPETRGKEVSAVAEMVSRGFKSRVLQ